MFDQLQIDKDIRVELQIPPSAKLNFKLNDEKLRREGDLGSAAIDAGMIGLGSAGSKSLKLMKTGV